MAPSVRSPKFRARADRARRRVPAGGLRVTILTEWMVPSAAARTASRPISAPVGTRIRAFFWRARSTRSSFSSNCATESGMKIRPLSMALIATSRNKRGGRHSTTMSQSFASSVALRTAMLSPTCGSARCAFFDVAHGHGGERETRDARDQAFCHFEPDRAETGKADAQRSFYSFGCVISSGR